MSPPRGNNRAPSAAPDARMVQVLVPTALWRRIEALRHQRSMKTGRSVSQQIVVVELLEADCRSPRGHQRPAEHPLDTGTGNSFPCPSSGPRCSEVPSDSCRLWQLARPTRPWVAPSRAWCPRESWAWGVGAPSQQRRLRGGSRGQLRTTAWAEIYPRGLGCMFTVCAPGPRSRRPLAARWPKRRVGTGSWG